MKTLRILAVLIGAASVLFGCILIVQYDFLQPVIPLLAGSSLLAIASIRRPVSRRRRQVLSLAWLAYTGSTVATIVLMALMAAPQNALAFSLGLLFVGTLASLRAVHLLTRNPRASLHNYYDR